MGVRPYSKSDCKFLEDMLLTEGLKPDDMGFTTGTTYVYDDNGVVKGFYTYRMDNKFPYLVHLCTDRAHRGLSLALNLIRDFKKRIHNLGYTQAIINCPIRDGYTRKMIEWYFKTKPYAEESQHGFYLIGA